MAFYEVAFSVR